MNALEKVVYNFPVTFSINQEDYFFNMNCKFNFYDAINNKIENANVSIKFDKREHDKEIHRLTKTPEHIYNWILKFSEDVLIDSLEETFSKLNSKYNTNLCVDNMQISRNNYRIDYDIIKYLENLLTTGFKYFR